MRYIPGKALGPGTARSAARQAWGPVNSCKQVVPGVYTVDTWGHGGYIVAVGPNEPFALDVALRSIPDFYLTEYTLAGVPVVTWYMFEEDCDWAVLLHYHPELLALSIAKGYLSATTSLDDVATTVKGWNPTLLREAA